MVRSCASSSIITEFLFCTTRFHSGWSAFRFAPISIPIPIPIPTPVSAALASNAKLRSPGPAIGSTHAAFTSLATLSTSFCNSWFFISFRSFASAAPANAARFSVPSGAFTTLIGLSCSDVCVWPRRNCGSSSRSSISISSSISLSSNSPSSSCSLPVSSKYMDPSIAPAAINCLSSHLSGELIRFVPLPPPWITASLPRALLCSSYSSSSSSSSPPFPSLTNTLPGYKCGVKSLPVTWSTSFIDNPILVPTTEITFTYTC
ncbi:hypothetical protein AX774_g5403 [Zancudomyces culisetae]|uniref:Uncharacterized protein n=1 Tax=Zancudomyces culisetae TaxID=1213189 RepID=A0A1R1PJJ4_ZANCU|nr:hypothetical protein AX774_g5403 [Zancudomyces culisetae]|eukprot:OMH81145.1 hypothetical protein AX774_g5403 [Zancudomyces culisetae]